MKLLVLIAALARLDARAQTNVPFAESNAQVTLFTRVETNVDSEVTSYECGLISQNSWEFKIERSSRPTSGTDTYKVTSNNYCTTIIGSYSNTATVSTILLKQWVVTWANALVKCNMSTNYVVGSALTNNWDFAIIVTNMWQNQP